MRRMSTAQAVRAIGRPIFTTGEIARLAHSSLSVTSRVLRSMATRGGVKRVVRGVWYLPDDPRFSVYSLIHYLAGGHRAYISFVSALHLQGIIEQIPQLVYAATTGHTKLLRTSVGTFSFHRLTPELFGGFDWYQDRRDFLIATPEKALVDSLYLSSRRSARFRFFPELEFPKSFSFRRAIRWARLIPYGLIRRHALTRLEEIRPRS